MNSNLKIIIIIFLILLYAQFFGAIPIKNNYLFLGLIPIIVYGFFNKKLFGTYIFMMIFGLCCSILSSYYFRDQGIIDSLYVTAPYFFICLYFVFTKFNLPVDICERIILGLSILFCICYIVQYIVYPIEIFKGANDNSYDEEIRIRMYAQGFSSLGYFFGLNKLIIKKQSAYLLLVLLCVSVIFLMGFRTMSIMIILISFVMVVRLTGLNKKLLIYIGLISIIVFFLLQTPFFSSIVDRMVERNQTQNFSNKDYIRVQEWEYYTGKHFTNVIEYFLGSGLPFPEKGKYGIYMTSLLREGIQFVDFGLLGLSWMIGVIPVTAMIFYSIFAIRIRVKKEYYYLGSWFLYLLSISLTTFEFARPGNFIVQALCLYIIGKVMQVNNTDNYKLPVRRLI